jgi:hypothetical protein
LQVQTKMVAMNLKVQDLWSQNNDIGAIGAALVEQETLQTGTGFRYTHGLCFQVYVAKRGD